MRRIVGTVASVSASLVCVVPAMADEPDYAGVLLHNETLLTSPPKDCDGKTVSLSNFELQQCSAVAFRDADRAMNDAYQAALKSRNTGRNDKLKQAQRLWVTFRNLDCRWQSLAFEGGRIEPVAMGNCLVEVTRQRVRTLQDHADH